jgi:hypothetical protein
MAERIDYSWEDQGPEQIQSWHESEGELLNPVDSEVSLYDEDRGPFLNEGDEEDVYSEESEPPFTFDEWLEENLSPREIDILLSIPIEDWILPTESSIYHKERLSRAYGMSTSEVSRANRELWQAVHGKLQTVGLLELFPWKTGWPIT